LQITLSPHQIGLERRAEGIAFPAHAVDFGPALAHQGVVDGCYQWGRRRQVGVNLEDRRAKQ
jgi:hypothetical protein